LASGVKYMPSSAALMSARVPVKVSVPSAVPSPSVKVRPVVRPSVSTPWVTESVTCTGLLAASASEMERALPLAVEKTNSAESSGVLCAAGTVLTGASLTLVTAVLSESVLLPEPGSAVFEPTLTVASIEPPSVVGTTWMASSGALPGTRLGRVQVTTPAASAQLQSVPVPLTKVEPAGTGKVTTTLDAALGPVLATLTV
jgi:hypothetical protein